MAGQWLVLSMFLVLSVSSAGCNGILGGVEPRLAYLKADHPRMIVEIDYQPGKAPRNEAISLLQTRIQETCNKPEGVQVERDEIPVSSRTWTTAALRDVEEEHRDTKTDGGTASLYVLYLGGNYAETRDGGQVLGVQYGSTIVLFRDVIESAATPVGLSIFGAGDVERSVLVHEFGHALGLVNIRTKMVTPHEDTSHPDRRGHSSNKDSVMYWAIESDAISRFFTGPPPTQFDANDKADLRAAGGK